MSEVSQLRVYSLGVVAANKALSSKDIEVTPLEDAPLLNGAITDTTTRISSKAQDAAGSAYQTEVPTSLTVKATWLPLGESNRVTAPDVRRGTTVVLYRFADQDKFWWTTLHADMKLRKLETVIWAISGTKDEEAEPNGDNTYFMEWSSHKKMLHIHTSKADGEPYAYDIQVNAKDGFIVIQDDIGNAITLESAEHRLRLVNTDNTEVVLDKKALSLNAVDSITHRTKAYKVECDTHVVTAKSSASMTTPTNAIKAVTSHQGSFGLAGNLTQGGETGGTGTANFNGTVNATQDVKAGSISLNSHRHGNGPTPS